MSKNKHTNIFLFIPFILVLSLLFDIFVAFIVIKLDLQIFKSNYFFILPIASSLIAALITYISLNRSSEDKIIFSLIIFLMTLLIAIPTMIIGIGIFAIAHSCALQAPGLCEL